MKRKNKTGNAIDEFNSKWNSCARTISADSFESVTDDDDDDISHFDENIFN